MSTSNNKTTGGVFKTIVIVQSLIIFLFGIIIFGQIMGISYWREELYTNCSSSSNFDYNGLTYCVRFFERKEPLTSSVSIWITRERERNLGVVTAYDTDSLGSLVYDQEWKDSLAITWSSEGVEIDDNLRKIFISKESFMGGR